MKKTHFEDVHLDPLVADGFVNMAIGSFAHFTDAPLNCSVSIIKLEKGSTPYHNHEHANQHEVIFVLSGHGVLKTEAKEESVREGDILYFSPTEYHQVECPDTSVVVASIHINAI